MFVAGQGTWSVNGSTGEITFQPLADYDGSVSDISYTVRDDDGGLSITPAGAGTGLGTGIGVPDYRQASGA